MSNITAIIVEDEKNGMEKMVQLLADYFPNINILDTCFDGTSAIKSITNNQPQLVFLDIELGNMLGFDVLASVKHISFETIITTAHKEYGIDAVKAGAIDYLLKPFGREDLQMAVSKVLQKIKRTPRPISKIVLPDTDGKILVDVNDILYCEADNNSTIIHLKSSVKPLYIVKTMGKIYADLPQNIFCRLSRSHIANMNNVVAYSRIDGGSVTLTNGKVLLLKPGIYKDAFLVRLSQLQ